MRVTVKEDLSAISSDGRLAASETLNLHFLRNVKVAIVRDMTTEETFSIPYNSNVKLGLIYQPSPYDESASPYMQLKSAADVMKLKQLPLVVTATTSYDGGAVDRSVSEGEVLFVRGTVKGSGIAKGKQLQVVNFLGVEKQLSSKCTGSFSTDPRHMKLHLSALLQRDIEWPQYVILYPDKEVGKRLPASMSNTPVLLEELKRETSVIATSEFEGEHVCSIFCTVLNKRTSRGLFPRLPVQLQVSNDTFTCRCTTHTFTCMYDTHIHMYMYNIFTYVTCVVYSICLFQVI